jgi:hypothetical protein
MNTETVKRLPQLLYNVVEGSDDAASKDERSYLHTTVTQQTRGSPLNAMRGDAMTFWEKKASQKNRRQKRAGLKGISILYQKSLM